METAEGGTFFLDEIGDMPLPIQIKLLRVLEQREIMRLGSNNPIPINVRFVFATNRDLEEMVRTGKPGPLYIHMGQRSSAEEVL